MSALRSVDSWRYPSYRNGSVNALHDSILELIRRTSAEIPDDVQSAIIAALELNPNHYGAWQGMGVCRIKLGDIREACRCLRAALKILPYDEPTRNALKNCEELLRRTEPSDRPAAAESQVI